MLKQWQVADRALLRLRDAAPAFDVEACVLKSVAVNALYGTQVLAIVRMAQHIAAVIAETQIDGSGPELVERIASLPTPDHDTPRRFVSFAAKFCHFFVDEERFPIYDEAARNAIKLHLGEGLTMSNAEQPYHAYCENLKRLRGEARLGGRGRELDRYLWIVGMYMKWLASRHTPKPQLNVELRQLFEKPGQTAAELDALLPAVLEKAFKGEL